MKTFKILAITLSMSVLVSCSKNELSAPADQQQPNTSVMENTSAISAWISVSNVANSGKAVGTKGFSGIINDPAINADVLANGIVLVFAKDAGKGQSLPFIQSGSIYWYYQVEEGQIIVSAEGSTDQSREFQYIVLTADQLNDLEARGYSKDAVINISWDAAEKLLATSF